MSAVPRWVGNGFCGGGIVEVEVLVFVSRWDRGPCVVLGEILLS